MSATTDTIVAVSSPPGGSARGLVRVAGAEVRAVAAGLLGEGCDLAGRRLQRGVMRLSRALTPRPFGERLGEGLAANQQTDHGGSPSPSPSPREGESALALPVLYAFFAGPGSATGQDMLEVQCPGHPALLDRVLHAAMTHGARLAEPGEFTFRAFVAGKIDLTQAEGVAATIAAVSDTQLAAAGHLRRGELGRFASELVRSLARRLALVEAGIDFTDQEDVVPIGPAELDAALTDIHARLTELLRHSRAWGALDALPRVVLVGPPSTGKSTLFNALLGRQRAVTAQTPGTTRDVLSEPWTLRTAQGRLIEVMLVDIAGLDRAEAALDRDIQQAARDAMAQADLLLVLHDPTQGRGALQAALPPHVKALHVRNKADLSGDANDEALHISALHGTGLEALRQRVAAELAARGVSVAGEQLALQPRHEASLRAAAEALHQARSLLQPQRDRRELGAVELIAQSLRQALDELAQLGGEMTPDDIIGQVFATFCVGK